MDTMTNPELTEQENAAATLTSDSTQVQADPAPQVESDTQTDTASHPEAASPTEQPESPPETGQPKQAQAKRTAAAKKRRRMAAQRMRLHNVLLAGVFLLILLVPYIKHYYLLENGTQTLYRFYDRLDQLSLGTSVSHTVF